MSRRQSFQSLLPDNKPASVAGRPDIYPSQPIVAGRIESGYAALAQRIAGQPRILIDGFCGIFWEDLRTGLEAVGVHAIWIATADYLKPAAQIETMLAPFLGGDDPLFGRRFGGSLADFFDLQRVNAALRSAEAAAGRANAPVIIYGAGAFLFGEGFRVYLDLPKNEAQYRSRAGAYRNIGVRAADEPQRQYKRMHFVDWPALNRHKAEYAAGIDLFVDGQDPAHPRLLTGAAVRATFAHMTRTTFRARPWFEPGVWGGQWLKQNQPGLSAEAPNYAWSFEMIAPEQGILLEHDGALMELSCDWLQYHDNAAVLGDYADIFGFEFPIRFNFLDTIGGGSLSLQCHPRPAFIRRRFGERFTQDETYYIFAAEPGACVYLGFQAGVDRDAFRRDLEASQASGAPVDVERYVQRHRAAVGDLFLIPNGAVHCAGAGSVVLEISATPYIYTFKLYDWLRSALDGRPRPLNIERAFANLDFALQGDAVRALLSRPLTLRDDVDCRVEQLPTHQRHFYDIFRLTLRRAIDCCTDGSPQVLMVTAGEGVLLHAEGLAEPRRFNFAETFIVPAACETFRLSACGDDLVTVVRACLRRSWFEASENRWIGQAVN